jgi:1-acyl-sn-glycerol-3-phosphate acyltransferase
MLATKAGVPIIPAAIAGTFESWPRGRLLPARHPIHVHFAPPIPVEQVKSLGAEALTSLIRERILECQSIAREGLARLSGVEEG